LPQTEPPKPGLHFPATRRNREPILAVLARILPPAGMVLEVASGSGEHAAYFASRLPGIVWQPSDRDPTLLASIAAHASAAGAPNIRPPVRLDVGDEPWPVGAAGAVVAINMLHVAPWSACAALLQGAARALSTGGPLFLYGPFKRGGRHTAPSNDAFDRSLRGQDPSWGVRDLEEVAKAAEAAKLMLDEAVEMPANNLGVIFRKRG
jgi:SAM-dependent methyltransferase